jgi:hypothetical protein
MAGGIAQVVEGLPSIHKALGSVPSTTKPNKEQKHKWVCKLPTTGLSSVDKWLLFQHLREQKCTVS